MTPDDLAGIPDGVPVRFTVEGRLTRAPGWRCINLHGTLSSLAEFDGSPTGLVASITAVEVLPEPVVEPTGDWAVVLDRYGAPWLRHSDGRWRGPDGTYRWAEVADVGPLKVVFGGVGE